MGGCPNAPPASRRQIIAFDPAALDAPSVSEFRREVGISRPSFDNLRERYAAEGNAALNPRSRAPKTPARVFERDTVEVVLQIRRRLTGKGRDADRNRCGMPASMMGCFPRQAAVGVNDRADPGRCGGGDANPRKRPRKSFIRFQRAAAMPNVAARRVHVHAVHRGSPAGHGVSAGGRLDPLRRGYLRVFPPGNGDDAVAVVSAAIAAMGCRRNCSPTTVSRSTRRGAAVSPRCSGSWPIRAAWGSPGRCAAPPRWARTNAPIRPFTLPRRPHAGHPRARQRTVDRVPRVLQLPPTSSRAARRDDPHPGVGRLRTPALERGPDPHADLHARAIAHKAQAEADKAASAAEIPR